MRQVCLRAPLLCAASSARSLVAIKSELTELASAAPARHPSVVAPQPAAWKEACRADLRHARQVERSRYPLAQGVAPAARRRQEGVEGYGRRVQNLLLDYGRLRHGWDLRGTGRCAAAATPSSAR